MYRESEAMKDIHKIQEQIYEETKHMTDEQKIGYINKAAEAIEKKYNLNLKKAVYTN